MGEQGGLPPHETPFRGDPGRFRPLASHPDGLWGGASRSEFGIDGFRVDGFRINGFGIEGNWLMNVILAESAGFCFGVQRAVSICEKAADDYSNCTTLGPIIHNEYVTRYLETIGIGVISEASEAMNGSTVIIRSHGAARKEHEALAELGVNIVDATCPEVRRIHATVHEESDNGRMPVIIGDRGHPEVTAIAGWCSDCEVFEAPDELKEWLSLGNNAYKPLSFVFQTTSKENIYDSVIEIIKKVCTNYKIFDTICNATRKRQQEAVELSKIADAMVVIGGKNSANSLRLADICKEHCDKVYFIENAKELESKDICITDTICITAGASTPAWIIKEVTQKMSEEVKFDETRIDNYVQEIPAGEDAQPGVVEEERPAMGNDLPTIGDEWAQAAAVVEPEAAIEEPEAVAGAQEIANDGLSTVSDDAADAADAESGIANGALEAFDEAQEAVDDESAAIGDGIQGDVAATDTDTVNGEAEASDDARDIISDEQLTVGDRATDSDAPGSEIAAGEPEPAAGETAFVAGAQEASTDERETDAGEPEAAALTESFEEMLEKSIKTLHTGQKVTGVITSITATEVSVDLGTKQSGYIPISEFTDESNTRIEDIVKIGDTIESFVMRVNDVEGMVMLSKKRLDAIRNWDEIEASKDSKAVVSGLVTEENKGGIVVNVKGVRVFVPASQTGLPKSAPMTELVRKTVKLRITEVNQSRRRVVGSIRAVQADERRERSDRLWEDIEKGKEYEGVVKSMTSYGVFVDIGGVDGMIHISELSWTRIKQPSEIMAIGDEVKVYVLSFDKENRKISLGYKKNEDNPWTKFTTNFAIGDIVSVKIVKMMPFGAFAEICPGVDGLIHISQISDHRIGVPSEVLSNGQMVDVKITEIDFERKKVSLSIRALIDPTSQPISEVEAAKAINADKSPVVVYETQAASTANDVEPLLINREEEEEAGSEEPPAGIAGEAGITDTVTED